MLKFKLILSDGHSYIFYRIIVLSVLLNFSGSYLILKQKIYNFFLSDDLNFIKSYYSSEIGTITFYYYDSFLRIVRDERNLSILVNGSPILILHLMQKNLSGSSNIDIL